MIVVADTSPINYLVLIGHDDVLGQIYGRVTIPAAVFDELSASSAPAAIWEWVKDPPQWLEIDRNDPGEDATLDALDRGERHAIALAQRLSAARLIVDDGAARREAEKRGIPVIGLLGVLAEAARRGLLSLPDALRALQATSFFVSQELIERLLALDRQRRE
jgi:predicted nucleic acid-binding protein